MGWPDDPTVLMSRETAKQGRCALSTDQHTPNMDNTIDDELQGIMHRVLDLHPAPWSLEAIPSDPEKRISKPAVIVRDANTNTVHPLHLIRIGDWDVNTLVNSGTHHDVMRLVVAAVNLMAGKVHGKEDVVALPPQPSRPEWGSAESLQRVAADWKRYAKEDMGVEYKGHAYYGYGSELACMRLYAIYRDTIHGRVAYSNNLKTWFFSLELS